MGIFNKSVFDEIGKNFKILGEKIKNSFDDGEKTERKCVYCGAVFKENEEKCPNCGALIKIVEKENKKRENYEIKRYPVLVQYEKDEGFYAYDCQTEITSETYNTVEKALKDLKDGLQEVIDDGDGFDFWTEEKLSSKFYAKSMLKKGAKIKYIELEYLNPENDPDW